MPRPMPRELPVTSAVGALISMPVMLRRRLGADQPVAATAAFDSSNRRMALATS